MVHLLYQQLCCRGNTNAACHVQVAASLFFISVMNYSAAHTDEISNKLILFSSAAVWIALKCSVSLKQEDFFFWRFCICYLQ
jgi:uncharacterized membrane protein YobD (UPF0266 family)